MMDRVTRASNRNQSLNPWPSLLIRSIIQIATPLGLMSITYRSSEAEVSDRYLIDIDRYFIWEGPASDITETKHIWCHIEDIFTNACIGSCHFDNFQCSQWHIFFSMKTFPFQWFLYALPEIYLFLLWNIWVVSYLHTIYLVDRQSFKRCYSALSFKQYSVTPVWYQQKRINSALNEIFRPSQIRYQWRYI